MATRTAMRSRVLVGVAAARDHGDRVLGGSEHAEPGDHGGAAGHVSRHDSARSHAKASRRASATPRWARTRATKTRRPRSPRSSTTARRRPASRSRSTPPTTTPSRTRSARTCRARLTTSSSGSPATASASSPPRACCRRSTTSGPRSSKYSTPGLQDRLHRRRRQDVLRPGLQLPVGRPLPEEPVHGEGLHLPEDARRVQGPRRQDEGRRHRPDRVRRPGRLAGDGHLRHPQHADERVRLPHRPDGRPREVDRPEGQGRLREVEGAAPLLPGGRAGPHVAGRREGRARRKTAGMYFLGTFALEQAGDDGPRRRVLPVPDPRDRVRRRERHGRPDRRVHDGRQPQEPRGGQGVPQVRRHRPRPRSSTSPAPASAAPPCPRSRTPAATPRSRRPMPRSSRAPARSPSSSIATRGPTSPARRACRAS